MSDPGLYTNLYARLRDCAELIDDVIIDLESGRASNRSSEREELSCLLRTLQAAPASDMSAALLASVLQESPSGHRVDWGEVADAIESGDPSPSVVEKLESLAHALENERAEIQSRMLGSHAR